LTFCAVSLQCADGFFTGRHENAQNKLLTFVDLLQGKMGQNEGKKGQQAEKKVNRRQKEN